MAPKASLILLVILIASSAIAHAQILSSTATSRLLPYSQRECRTAQSNCTDMVYPYLQNPQYMFPTSLEHINDMCKMWSKFVDCIRRYISNCFEESRRALFHKSVENSIDTVHAVCSSTIYRNEYLTKATCFRQVSIDFCGASYQQLIDIVSNANANDDHICCYYAQFKDCVNRPLLEQCGRKAKNLMDHSMSFLISRCNYYSNQNSKECIKPPVFAQNSAVDDEPDSLPESSTLTVTNFQSNNNIDTAASSRIEASDSANFDTSAEVDSSSQPQSSEMKQSSPPPMTHSAEVSAENSIDAIEASESDGRSAEQLIVYTMKPESQIGSLGFGSGSVGSFGLSSVGHLVGHAMRLGLVVGWIRWLQQ